MKKKYLMIVEKSSIAKNVESVLKKTNLLNTCDIDIVTVNNHVIDINDTILVSEDNIKAYKPFILKNKTVGENHHVCDDYDVHKMAGEKIQTLVRKNTYDALINGCDLDREGDLMFEYTLESLGLEPNKTIRLRIVDLSDAGIKTALLTLFANN